MEEQKLTFGEKAVGLTFNPSSDQNVDKLKKLYAEIIDTLNLYRKADGSEMDGDTTRLIKIAITEAQGAQMWAVKAVTWK